MVLPMLFLDLFGILFFSDFIERVPIHTILALYVILYIGKLFFEQICSLEYFFKYLYR